MDIAALINNILQSEWTEDNPTVNEVSFREMEFDIKSPLLQVLIENFPERSVWIIRGLYRVEHRIRITIFLKLIKYDEDTVNTARTRWFNVKEEINRILIKNKFSINGVSNLDLPTGWDDINSIAVGRGIKTTREPIIWQSEQVIKAVYYTVEDLEEE